MLDRIAVAPEASEPAARRALLDRARHRGFRRFVLPVGDPQPEPAVDLLFRDGEALRPAGARPPVPVLRVSELPSLEKAVREVPDGGILAVEWTADRVIPLEAAVAARAGRFRLWTFARRASEVPAALGALEHGADLVIVTVRSAQEIDELERAVGGAIPSGLDWHIAPVVEVGPAGIGDRVIVDTTSLLNPDEGLLVGSAAAFLLHVASEAVGSTFSRPRPFRVNAGAAHSYVLTADGTTRYLSELVAGDVVLVSAPRGSARAVRVGRIKIERRPMVMVRVEDGTTPRTVFLQEAETVRLSSESGRIPTTELGPGARLFGVRLAAARHLGVAVEETIEER